MEPPRPRSPSRPLASFLLHSFFPFSGACFAFICDRTGLVPDFVLNPARSVFPDFSSLFGAHAPKSRTQQIVRTRRVLTLPPQTSLKNPAPISRSTRTVVPSRQSGTGVPRSGGNVKMRPFEPHFRFHDCLVSIGPFVVWLVVGSAGRRRQGALRPRNAENNRREST